MAKEKGHEFAILALVAIVAVVGLVVMFLNKGATPVASYNAPVMAEDAGNIGGEAFATGCKMVRDCDGYINGTCINATYNYVCPMMRTAR